MTEHRPKRNADSFGGRISALCAWLFVALLVLTPPVVAQQRDASHKTRTEAARAEKQLAKSLTRKLSVNFENDQLDGVLDLISNRTGSAIAPIWPAIERAGIERDAPVTLTLEQVSARRVLGRVLEQVTADIDRKLVLHTHAGVALISTPAHLPALMSPVTLDESAADRDRRALAKLKNRVPVTFNENRLATILEYYHNTTGLAFNVRWPSLKKIGVKEAQPVTLHANNYPAKPPSASTGKCALPIDGPPAELTLRLTLFYASAMADRPIVYRIEDGAVTALPGEASGDE